MNLRARLFIIGVIGLLLAGCTSANTPLPTPTWAIPIDAIFATRYESMGGLNRFGYGLTPLYQNGPFQIQYTENAVFVRDPNRPVETQVFLMPVGPELISPSEPLAIPPQEGIEFIGGHVIYAPFVQIFREMGGAAGVGNPITDVMFNREKQRYEQYFDNVGFYIMVSDPTSTVHLLSYGYAFCKQVNACPDAKSPRSETIISRDDIVPQIFSATTERLGTDFVGEPITAPYLTSDGMVEQIYGNMILQADQTNLNNVHIRPFLHELGIFPEATEAQSPDVRFAYMDGFNVPVDFKTYIIQHGGPALSGKPISRLTQVNGALRQCFEYLCLEFRRAPDGSGLITVAPLGLRYYQKMTGQVPTTYTMRASEKYPTLPRGERQTISVIISTESGAPAINISPVIYITNSSGQVENYSMPPSNESGVSAYTLPNIPSEAGQVINYQICISPPGGEPTCTKDSWLMALQ